MDNLMFKNEYVVRYAEENGITKKQAAEEIDRFITTTYRTLATGIGIRFTGFGSFTLKRVNPAKYTVRVGPKSGEDIVIPAHYSLRFTPSEALKAAVKEIEVE